MKVSKKSILGAVIGNAMEWYDYILYGHFVFIISKVFFPLQSTLYSNLLALSVFAIGFFTRPLGGYIFGLMGDKLGRKRALTTSMLLMALPTAALAVLPSFHAIGVLAPVVVIIIRILQGVALGGENTSAITYLFEVGERRRVFVSSLAPMALLVGVMFASLTILAIEGIFSTQQIEAYAWRIPFALSILYSAFGIYIRKRLYETVDFERLKASGALVKTPFLEVLKHHKRAVFTSMAVFTGSSIPFYVMLVFSKRIFLQSGIAPSAATLLNFAGVAICAGWIPLTALIAERYGIKKVLMASFGGILLFAFPFLYLIESGSFALALLASFGAAVVIGVPLAPFYGQSFPAKVRSSGVSFSCNVPAALFGGTAPLCVEAILSLSGGNILPLGFYLVFSALLGGIGVYYGKFIENYEKL